MRRKLLRWLENKYDFKFAPRAGAKAAEPYWRQAKNAMDILSHPISRRQRSEYKTIPAIQEGLFFRSSICSAIDFRSPEFLRWRQALGEPPRMHRKTWEHVFIASHLEAAGMLAPGRRGLGFGVGTEPSPALFAALGAEIVATDMDPAAAGDAGWISTDQHASSIDMLNARGLCPKGEFEKLVSFSVCDMNAIPTSLTEFDFCWSACSLEHLGSIRAGIEFVRKSMKTLKSGGVAVHTTEYNISSNDRTIDDNPTLVVFRRRDIEDMVQVLRQDGYFVSDICFDVLSEPIDLFVDVSPFKHDPHLRLLLGGFVCSSIGIVIQKP